MFVNTITIIVTLVTCGTVCKALKALASTAVAKSIIRTNVGIVFPPIYRHHFADVTGTIREIYNRIISLAANRHKRAMSAQKIANPFYIGILTFDLSIF